MISREYAKKALKNAITEAIDYNTESAIMDIDVAVDMIIDVAIMEVGVELDAMLEEVKELVKCREKDND